MRGLFFLLSLATAAFLPAEKLQTACNSLGGKLHIPLNITVFFSKYSPSSPSLAPVSPNDYICLKSPKFNETSATTTLSSLLIPVPGAPVPYLVPSDEPAFTAGCATACGGASGNPMTGIITYGNETLGVCTCYKKDVWPYSPKLEGKKPVAAADEFGRYAGAPEPIDPYTFQTCGEYSAVQPLLGLASMACPCQVQPWPYADMKTCKWADKPTVIDVPGAIGVWKYNMQTSLIEGCPVAAQRCNAACGVEAASAGNATEVAKVACFDFASIQTVCMMCQCKSGKYPTKIEEFTSMSAVDSVSGKIPGNISGSGAGRVAASFVVFALATLIL